MASIMIPCKNPDLSNQEITYLTAAVAAAAASIAVSDYEGFADNDYLVLGTYGKEQSEIAQVSDASIDASIVLEAGDPVYAHPAYTKVTKTPWNQIKFWSAASKILCDALTTSSSVLATENIEFDSEYTYYADTTGSSTTWYRTAFYNSETSTFSSLSDSVQATGYAANSRGRMKAMVLSLFGDKTNKWVSETDLDNFFYHIESEIMNYRKRWTFEQEYKTYDLTIGTTKYALDTIADDIKETEKKFVHNVWIENGDPLDYLDRKEMNQKKEGKNWTTVATEIAAAATTGVVDDVNVLAEAGTLLIDGENDITYTATTESSNTLTGLAEVSSTKAVGAEVWQYDEGGEAENYTIWKGVLELDTPPDETYTMHIDYTKKPSLMDSDGDISVINFSQLIISGVLALCYQQKGDIAIYKQKWGEFQVELEKRSQEERSGQKKQLVPDDRTGYIKGIDFLDFDDSKLGYRIKE